MAEKNLIPIGERDVAAHRKVVEKAVSREAFANEFGEDRVTDHADGSWTGRLEGQRELDAFDAMDRERIAADIEAGNIDVSTVRNELADTSVVRDGRGNSRRCPDRHAAIVDRMAHEKRRGRL